MFRKIARFPVTFSRKQYITIMLASQGWVSQLTRTGNDCSRTLPVLQPPNFFFKPPRKQISTLAHAKRRHNNPSSLRQRLREMTISSKTRSTSANPRCWLFIPSSSDYRIASRGSSEKKSTWSCRKLGSPFAKRTSYRRSWKQYTSRSIYLWLCWPEWKKNVGATKKWREEEPGSEGGVLTNSVTISSVYLALTCSLYWSTWDLAPPRILSSAEKTTKHQRACTGLEICAID